MEQLPAIGSTWRLTQSDVDTGATKYDLYVKLDDRGDEVLVRFHYATDLFERQTIARMAMHWKALLKNGIECPDRRQARRPDRRHPYGPDWRHARSPSV